MERISFGFEKCNKRILVIYDIVDNKSRTRFSRFLESYGVRVQYSAFEFSLNDLKYKKMILEMKSFLNTDDNVRVYMLNDKNFSFMGIESNVDCDLIIF